MSLSRFAVLGALLLATSRPAMPDGELNSLDLGEADANPDLTGVAPPGE